MVSVKVNCSFCGKEIECPEDMLNAKKHACFKCFQNLEEKSSEEEIDKIHVDIPTKEMDDFIADSLVNSRMENVFPRVWSEKKSELKELSKRELAEEMFSAGAGFAVVSLLQTTREAEKKGIKKV